MNQDKIWEKYQNAPEFIETGCKGSGRHEYLVKRVPTGVRALNIGVGRGDLEEMLVHRGVDVSCLDPSNTSIEQLRERLNLVDKAQVGYSQSMPFTDDSFDYVIMSEVLEHLNDVVLEETLEEIKRVLRAGGQFIGTVPADENLQENIVVCPKCGEHFHRWGHVQSFTRDRLSDTLGGHFGGSSVKRVFFGDVNRLNWKGRISWFLKAVQATLGLRGGNQNFFFKASND